MGGGSLKSVFWVCVDGVEPGYLQGQMQRSAARKKWANSAFANSEAKLAGLYWFKSPVCKNGQLECCLEQKAAVQLCACAQGPSRPIDTDFVITLFF